MHVKGLGFDPPYLHAFCRALHGDAHASRECPMLCDVHACRVGEGARRSTSKGKACACRPHRKENGLGWRLGRRGRVQKQRASVARARLVLALAAARTRAVRATWHAVGRDDESQKGGWSCRDREHSSAVTRIRTWVVSATTRSTNHYTITANAPARAPLQLRGDRPPSAWLAWLAWLFSQSTLDLCGRKDEEAKKSFSVSSRQLCV